MTMIKLTSGARFSAKQGASILESAMFADVALPYSCRTGRCSTCRCKVLGGLTKALHIESGLNDAEKNEGWILSCVRTVESDVILEVDDLGKIRLPTVKTIPCRIAALNYLATDVLSIQLKFPPSVDFKFIPGQYIELIGLNGIRRSYSIANPDFKQRLLELHVKRVNAGVLSQYLFNEAKLNDLLRIYGPLGTFFIRETSGINLIFLATGTGIAPVNAMLHSIASLPKNRQPASITVLWGGRSTEDLYLNLSDISDKFSYIPVLSRGDANWKAARGYVQNILLSMKPDLSNSSVYACGSSSMINDAKKLLKQAGLPDNCFHSDAFVCSGAMQEERAKL